MDIIICDISAFMYWRTPPLVRLLTSAPEDDDLLRNTVEPRRLRAMRDELAEESLLWGSARGMRLRRARYGAAADSLQHISFTAKRGETVALIGATGCGKTTLINLIPRFYDVSQGRVLVDGVDVRSYEQEDLRNRIGYVSQKAILFSGGQKQRLSIARAVARKPEILIFDDSFSALDYRTDKALRQALRERTADSTKIIVAQRISTIRDADQILVLDHGKIVGKGTHEELLKNCPEYLEIAQSQLSKEEIAHG